MTGFDINNIPLIVGAIIEAQRQLKNDKGIKDVYQNHFNAFIQDHPLPESIIEDFEWARNLKANEETAPQSGDMNDK